MTTAPSLSHFPDYDNNTRAYLQSLQAGQKPDIRPSFGSWEPVVKKAEQIFDQTKKGSMVTARLQSLIKTQKYAGLKELLAGKSTKKEAPSRSAAEPEQGELLGMPALLSYMQIKPGTSAGACPELDWYEAFSKKASDRAYDEYHQFCGLWMFSVIAGRRVSLEIKQKKFYTNLMLSLCGATSFYAKSFTANVAKNMLYALDLGHNLAPNRITPQKLLSDMAGARIPTDFDDLTYDKKERIEQRLATPGQKGLLFDELGLFIQSMLRKNSTNADFADLLMTFDECPPQYENSTIARGGEPIEKPYLPLLGCMTPTNLKQNAKAGADFWNDGFFARFSFVVAPPPPKDKEDPGPPQVSELDDLSLPFPPALLESLLNWHERLGVPNCAVVEEEVGEGKNKKKKLVIERTSLQETSCTITTEARQAWVNYDHGLRQLCLKLGHEDFNGSYVRLAETAMRIAVLLASLSNDNHIELKHWAKAQELTEILRKNLHELYRQVNASEDKPSYAKSVEEKVQQYVAKFENETGDKDKIPTIRNLSRYIKGVDLTALRNAVINLKQVHLLEEKKAGKATYYVTGTGEPEDG